MKSSAHFATHLLASTCMFFTSLSSFMMRLTRAKGRPSSSAPFSPSSPSPSAPSASPPASSYSFAAFALSSSALSLYTCGSREKRRAG